MWDGHRRLWLLLVGAAGVCEPKCASKKIPLAVCMCVEKGGTDREGGTSYFLVAVIKYANKSHLRKKELFGLAVPEG